MAQNYIPFSRQVEVEASELARRLFWYVCSLGTICLDQPDHHESFEKPGAHLFWVVSGCGTLETQGWKYSLQPGNSVWLVDMMHPRIYTPQAGTRLVIRGIRFGTQLLRAWHEELGGCQRAEFALANAAEVRNAYREVRRIIQTKPAAWEWRVHLVLDRILGLLLRTRRAFLPAPVVPPAAVSRVLNAISAEPMRNWKARDMVRIARVSYSGLRKLFHQSQHESIHQFIQRTRLTQAKRLLADPGLSVKQVAERLHFASEFYFSHFFRRYAGLSPTEFRRRLQHATDGVTASISDGNKQGWQPGKDHDRAGGSK